ncbi:MAG TPA: Fic family protein [Actinomycetota bacterium]|nr:Fic family protein [Actinomycetota bacterium]
MIFKAPAVDADERRVIHEIEELRAQLRLWAADRRRWTGVLRRMSFARQIQASNSIEGYNSTLDDAVAIVEGEEPLDANEETRSALEGYRQAMTYVLQLADDPHFEYSTHLLKGLHFMMMSYNLGKSPGRYRLGYVYIRNDSTGEIVYEGPDADRVPALVEEIAGSLNERSSAPPMVRAAMAHLNLVLVHPFRDGNGRMARGLQTLVLTREGILSAEFCSIEEYLGRNTASYYDVLASVGGGYWQPENDARPWVRYCLKAHYVQARTLLRRIKESERLWAILSEEAELHRLPERSISALFEAARGFRVRNATYRPLSEVTEQTATRDLKQLVNAGLLVPKGERRGRHYVASDRLRELRGKSLEVRIPIEDPFKTVDSAEKS